MSPVDYLAVGHICADVMPGGLVVGGTVAYAGRVAQVSGCQTAVLSSAAPDYAWEAVLPGVLVHSLPAPHTTTFENRDTPHGRQQTLHARAAVLKAEDVPTHWRNPTIVHLAPVADEVDMGLVRQFPHSLVGMTPQGWLRGWDENGRIFPRVWAEAASLLPLATAVIVSQEDLPDQETLAQYREWANLLVMTQGAAGCLVFWQGESRHIPAPLVTEVETTGAGDIFAAAFFIRLQQTGGNVWESAVFANQIAAQSVTQNGLQAKLAQIEEFFTEGHAGKNQ